MISEAWKGGGGPQRHLHGGLPLPQLSYLPSPADLVSIYTPAWLPQQPRLPYFRSPDMRKVMEAGWFPLRLGGFHGNTASPCSPECSGEPSLGHRDHGCGGWFSSELMPRRPCWELGEVTLVTR